MDLRKMLNFSDIKKILKLRQDSKSVAKIAGTIGRSRKIVGKESHLVDHQQ